MARFTEGVDRVAAAGPRPTVRHTACSAAAILFPRTHFDMARVGIGLYGLWPSRETLVSARERGLSGFALSPVMTWKALLAQVKDVPAGGYVGYGRTWRAQRRTRIAVIPVGYFEGYSRALSSRAHVLVRGQRAPVLGRVCMNMFMVDVTDVPGAAAGDVAVLLGRDGEETVSAEALAGWASTIHYEITTRVNPLLPRVAVSPDLLHPGRHGLELGRGRLVEQVEDGGLGGGDHRPGLPAQVQPAHPVLLGPARHRVGADLHVVTHGDEVARGLEDADVGLHAGDHHLLPARGLQRALEDRVGAAGEVDLLEGRGGEQLEELGDGVPSPFGYCSVQSTGRPRVFPQWMRARAYFTSRA